MGPTWLEFPSRPTSPRIGTTHLVQDSLQLQIKAVATFLVILRVYEFYFIDYYQNDYLCLHWKFI